MRASRTLAIVLRQIYLLRGSPTRLLPMIAWVAIDIVLWGFITRYLSALTGPKVNLVASILGAVLLWDFLGRVMQGVTTAFFEDVWSRNFLNIFATPLTIADYIGGLVLTGIGTSLLGLIAMLTLATTVFGFSFLAYGAAIVPFVLVLFVTGISLGILGAAIVLRLGPASEWLIWPIPSLLSPFVGVFYPLSTLPGWMQAIGRCLAPSYVFQAMRGIVAGQGANAGDLAFAVGLSVIYLLGACWVFARVYRFALRTGLIARYSAETAS
ncbi:ABC transporter permease [Phenylobacterium soli]|uniref:ABC transporter permease n=1 Tax=Phenylobacterium soli TaxID=2170551 RepID=A0A328AL10_9CAUL|nr:ABC transporter permease [Phenylobacterium soli]RAK55592.1 ABC transporter permease [Phenylobacterium soli]